MLLDAMVVARCRFDVLHELRYRTGCLVFVLVMQMVLWLFMPQDECTSDFSVVLLV